MFIPTTAEELKELEWESLDVILISGDTYIDSPYSGIALIGHQLIRAGFKTGIIAQPDLNGPEDIGRLGAPRLFWGVSAGMVDSMVANTTALGKPRRFDDNTPGGANTKRPNRASIVYTNLIKRWFKNPAPIVLGGIEASLRRVTHYDFWSDSLRRSILLDSKADFLLYGMADFSIIELAETLKMGGDPRAIRGLCYLSSEPPRDYIELPSFEACDLNKQKFIEMFNIFYENNDPSRGKGLKQKTGNRYVIQNPPAKPLNTEELDWVYSADFEHAVHPYYAAMGEVRAMETIRNSIVTHRGCYGECNFCAIASHEGRHISWRSKDSILNEARQLVNRKGFKGIIHDLSGPTANMYGYDCAIKSTKGACSHRSCIYPEVCPSLKLTHAPHLELLRELRELPNVRKVFVGSGIRYDMVMADKQHGPAYIKDLATHHVSGQLKLAPEHSEPEVLELMRVPNKQTLLDFKKAFETESAEQGLEQYLSYYLIAAHPGCNNEAMLELQKFASSQLGVLPEQVQIFTPTPSTYSSLMYYTEMNPFTGEKLFVEKSETGKMQQKAFITGWRNKPPKPTRREDREQHDDRERPRRPKNDEPVRETRIVRDDAGRFFMNRKPEGWVDRKPKDQKKPYQSERSDRDGKWRAEGERPTHDKKPYDPNRRPPRTEGERPPRDKKPYDPNRRPPRAEGERPPRDKKPYDPNRRPPRAEGERPPRDKKPYDPNRRPPRAEGERPPRDRSGKDYRKSQDQSSKPYAKGDKKDKHGKSS